MMTLQQFINLHPNIIQYDRAGVGGIDFDILHQRIESSRYLKTRQSFVYFVKNYARIIKGEFDDFKENTVEIELDERTRKQIEKAKMYLENLRTFKLKTTEEDLRDYGLGFFYKLNGTIELLEKAVQSPTWLITAFMEYSSIKQSISEFYEWKKSNG